MTDEQQQLTQAVAAAGYAITEHVAHHDFDWGAHFDEVLASHGELFAALCKCRTADEVERLYVDEVCDTPEAYSSEERTEIWARTVTTYAAHVEGDRTFAFISVSHREVVIVKARDQLEAASKLAYKLSEETESDMSVVDALAWFDSLGEVVGDVYHFNAE